METIDDYDKYCHYVAGLVGLGLSKLFYASGLEDMAPDSLSNSMGLFLQVYGSLGNSELYIPNLTRYFYLHFRYPLSVFLCLLQKTNIIRDYLEDINEIPKSRMFWPREIWSKYAKKLEVN